MAALAAPGCSAVAAGPGPGICSEGWGLPARAVLVHRGKSSWCWGAGPAGGLSHTGGENRKDATVWGFNIQHRKKKARKLYSIFPVKVIILHRTKEKSRRAARARPASGPALRLET